jgi:hypothetical protein
VYSCFGGFVFDDEGGYEGSYEGGSFGDDGAGAGERLRARGTYNEYGHRTMSGAPCV